MNPSDLIIALDMSTADDALLRFLAYLMRLKAINSVRFLHVVPTIFTEKHQYDSSKDITSTDYKISEVLEGEIRHRIDKYFPVPGGTNLDVKIIFGIPEDIIAQEIFLSESCLIVAGNKFKPEGSGVITHVLAANPPCSIALVPEGWHEQPLQILAVIDTSNEPVSCLQLCYDWTLAAKGVLPVEVMQLIDLPPISPFFSKPFNFDSKAEEQIRIAFEAELGKTSAPPAKFNFSIVLNEKYDEVSHIQEFLQKTNANLLVVDLVRPQMPVADLIWGTISENLVDRIKDCAILIKR